MKRFLRSIEFDLLSKIGFLASLRFSAASDRLAPTHNPQVSRENSRVFDTVLNPNLPAALTKNAGHDIAQRPDSLCCQVHNV